MRQVGYWVEQALEQRRDPGYDYQHMALVADVYEVQRAVQARALVVQQRSGTAAARRGVPAEARAGCERAARERGPQPGQGSGWPY